MISKEIIYLLKKYKVTSNTDLECYKWSLEDKKKLILVFCNFYNTNTNEFILKIIKSYDLQIKIKDLT